MRSLAALALVISVTTPAVAQEAPGPPTTQPAQLAPVDPPAPMQPMAPAETAEPPAYAPPDVPPPVYVAPMYAQPQPFDVAGDIESRARSKKIAGGILMAIGLVGAGVGFALSTASELNTPGVIAVAGGSHGGGFDLPGYLGSAQWIFGTILEALGSTVAEIGGVVYIVGGAQMRRYLKSTGRLTLAPTLSPSSAGARLAFSF